MLCLSDHTLTYRIYSIERGAMTVSSYHSVNRNGIGLEGVLLSSEIRKGTSIPGRIFLGGSRFTASCKSAIESALLRRFSRNYPILYQGKRYNNGRWGRYPHRLLCVVLRTCLPLDCFASVFLMYSPFSRVTFAACAPSTKALGSTYLALSPIV